MDKTCIFGVHAIDPLTASLLATFRPQKHAEDPDIKSATTIDTGLASSYTSCGPKEYFNAQGKRSFVQFVMEKPEINELLSSHWMTV